MSTEPALFRHKPNVVAAMQAPIRGENEAEKDFEERLRAVAKWVVNNEGEANIDRTHIRVTTFYAPAGDFVEPGGWIVQSNDGTWKVLSDTDFNADYSRI